jgi:hypothetical protein
MSWKKSWHYISAAMAPSFPKDFPAGAFICQPQTKAPPERALIAIIC